MTTAALSDPRPATRDDIPELVRLKAVLMETGWPFEVRVSDDAGWRERCTRVAERLVGQPDHGWFVVDAPHGLAACVSVTLAHHLPGPQGTGISAYLGDMVTDPAYRGQGLGRRLLDVALAWAAEQGAGRVELYSTESGRPIYEQAGFTADGPFRHLARRLG